MLEKLHYSRGIDEVQVRKKLKKITYDRKPWMKKYVNEDGEVAAEDKQ